MCFETFTYNPHIYSWNHIWQLVKILGIILAVAIHVSLCLVISCQGSEGSPPPCCVWLHGEKRPAMDIDVRNHAHENVETCTNKCIKNPATFQTKTQDPRGSNRALYVSKMVSTVEFLDHTWKMSKNHCPYIYLSYLPIYIYLYCFFLFFPTRTASNENHCQYILPFRLQSFWLQQRPLIRAKKMRSQKLVIRYSRSSFSDASDKKRLYRRHPTNFSGASDNHIAASDNLSDESDNHIGASDNVIGNNSRFPRGLILNLLIGCTTIIVGRVRESKLSDSKHICN